MTNHRRRADRPTQLIALGLVLALAGPGCEQDTAPASDRPAAPRPTATAPATPPDPAAREQASQRAETSVQNEPLQVRPLDFEIEPNARVAGLDLDGDGRDEIAVATVRGLSLLRTTASGALEVAWKAEAPGGATAIATGDLDADGRRDLVVGWGIHRDRRDAAAELRAYRSGGAAKGTLIEEQVSTPRTSRAQFASIQVTALEPGGSPGILFTHFASKYGVRGAFAVSPRAGAWSEREIYTMRMGSLLVNAPLTQDAAPSRLVVGRSYGDETRSPGDVFVLDAEGGRHLLPSLRGLRSLIPVALGARDAPLHLLCFGDGWHWRYRDEGRGRLSCTQQTPDGGLVTQYVALTDSYSLETLAPADLDGDGRSELIAQGANGLYRFTATPPQSSGSTGLQWSASKIGPGGAHFAVADTDGDGRDEIVSIGERLVRIALP